MHHALNLRLLAALCETTRCLQWHSDRHGAGMDAKAVRDAQAAIREAKAILAVEETKEIEGVRLTGLHAGYDFSTETLSILNCDETILVEVPKFGRDYDEGSVAYKGEIQAKVAEFIVALINSATGESK